MFGELCEQVRTARPLIHCITNYVTANDCANLLLACGASPIMADDPGEAEEITSLCKGLCLNLGTLNPRTVPSMLTAGRRANELGHPVVLDPVGVGASGLRTGTALRLLNELNIAVVRGNVSELRALASGEGSRRGVDAADRITEESLGSIVDLAKDFAQSLGAVVALTGAIDVVTDGDRAFCIRNGHPMMVFVTGSGCQLSALTAAYVAANPDRILEAAAAAVCAMGLCGEIAHDRLDPLDGNASYRNYILDAIYNLTPAQLEKGANYEVR